MEQDISSKYGTNRMIRSMKDNYNVAITSEITHIAEVTIWAVAYKYLIYKPEAPDENSDCFVIVNLENGNSTILVEDFL